MLFIVTAASLRVSNGTVYANLQGVRSKPIARDGEAGFATASYRCPPEVAKQLLSVVSQPQVCEIEIQDQRFGKQTYVEVVECAILGPLSDFIWNASGIVNRSQAAKPATAVKAA